MMASFRYVRDNGNVKLNNFLNRPLLEIIISSCLSVCFTEYQNFNNILNWLFT